MLTITNSPRYVRVVAAAAAASVSLILAGCGGDADVPEEEPEPTVAAVQYDGLPADLTAEQVCDLLDTAFLDEALQAPVRDERAGSTNPDCTWTHTLPIGTVTTLQLQVMSMKQTKDKLGTEALDEALGWAPTDSEIIEYPQVDAPHGGYVFMSSTIVFVVDPVGRLLSVASHSDIPEADRVAIINAALDALTERHS